MRYTIRTRSFAFLLCYAITLTSAPVGADEPAVKRAFIDGTGAGWVSLGEKDFTDVNGVEDTWTFKDGGIQSTGVPIGVNRSVKQYTNFELVFEWRHLKSGGNSGMFIWTPPKAVEALKGPGLPKGGIEVQVLDVGYEEKYRKRTGKEPDFFTCHGDIFAVGESKLKPFPPLSPNGSRSFPTKHLTKPTGEWNHYYVRAINGEVRLWVNGEEVSGGSDAQPATGYICMEAEGSPVEFRNLRIRELP